MFLYFKWLEENEDEQGQTAKVDKSFLYLKLIFGAYLGFGIWNLRFAHIEKGTADEEKEKRG